MNLTFSDSAKFAQAALNLIRGQGLQISHSFFSSKLLSVFSSSSQFSVGFLPLPSWILSFVFRFFPAIDQTIAITSLFFFALSTFLVYSIGKKLHSVKAGLISAMFFLSSLFFQEYAFNFASETVFIFLILLFIYLSLLPRKLKIFSLVPLILMFFVRQQAGVFLGSLLLTGLAAYLFRRKIKKDKNLFWLVPLVLIVGSYVVNYSASKISGSFNIATGSNFGSYIRGGGYQNLGLLGFVSKIFYNFYNFIKAPERLASITIFFLFLYSLFIKNKTKELGYFKLFTSISLFSFLLAASATLPNARYVHPIIPLVMICAGIGLVELVKNIPNKLRNFSLVILSLLIIFPTLGHLTLDARARAQQFNTDQPPVYRVISSIMAENIDQGHLIITNLDAWAAWYEGLTTMWFPLEIDMLDGYEDKVDYIVITNYKENDGDFALGDWAEVVYSPLEIENEFLTDNYNLLTTFEITADQVYENQSYQGTILISKTLESSLN